MQQLTTGDGEGLEPQSTKDGAGRTDGTRESTPLGMELQKRMSALGIEPKTLAKRLKVTVNSVYNWMKGDLPTNKHLQSVAEVLGWAKADLYPKAILDSLAKEATRDIANVLSEALDLAKAAWGERSYRLSLTAEDRPGIIASLGTATSNCGLNIQDITQNVFKARATVTAWVRDTNASTRRSATELQSTLRRALQDAGVKSVALIVEAFDKVDSHTKT